MWCSNCQQDVPVIASGDDLACCARCGLRGRSGRHANHQSRSNFGNVGVGFGTRRCAGGAPTAVADPPDVSGEDWLLDEEFRRLQSRYGKKTNALPAEEIDQPAAMWNAASTLQVQLQSARAATPTVKRRRHSTVAWLILSLGLMAFVCGGMLLGWALLAGRNELWNLGMPMALAGQFGLLLGLVLQLDSLWQANRHTADTLDDVDHRLQEIDHATTLLRSTHSGPAQSFYAHMAAGANPQLLLADLKGQLDLLTVKMAQR